MMSLRNQDTGAKDEREKHLEQIRKLKNKIKDQELSEDLRNNYAYLIMFNNWKKKKEGMGEQPKGYFGKPEIEGGPPN